jgi:hypothetical protein
MRRKLLIPMIGVAVSLAACGGTDKADKSQQSKPTTSSETAPPRGEASTPGSGGFIETSKAEVDRAAAEAPEEFKGEERQIYGEAKVVCAQVPRRVVQRNVALFAETLARGRETGRRAALAGCRAGSD